MPYSSCLSSVYLPSLSLRSRQMPPTQERVQVRFFLTSLLCLLILIQSNNRTFKLRRCSLTGEGEESTAAGEEVPRFSKRTNQSVLFIDQQTEDANLSLVGMSGPKASIVIAVMESTQPTFIYVIYLAFFLRSPSIKEVGRERAGEVLNNLSMGSRSSVPFDQEHIVLRSFIPVAPHTLVKAESVSYSCGSDCGRISSPIRRGRRSFTPKALEVDKG